MSKIIYDVGVILGHELNKDNSLSNQTKKRTDLGIKLFNDGDIMNLLMSGGHEDFGENYGISIGEAMKRYAMKKGVPEDKIFVEDVSWETVGEIVFCKVAIIDPKKWKKIAFVSHHYHVPRVRTIADSVFGKGFELTYKSADAIFGQSKNIIESEKVKERMFLEISSGMLFKDNDEWVNLLLTRHGIYNKSPDFFSKKLDNIRL